MIINLQIIRAFAAIIVVVFHIAGNGPENIQGTFVHDVFYNWGAAGVDLFFVLSGFIMVYTQDQKERRARKFLVGRIIRIVPLYWFVSVAWCTVLVASSPYFAANSFDFWHILASLTFVSQLLGYGDPFIVPGWTLEYEALFYIVFACSLLFFKNTYFLILLSAIALISITPISSPIVIEFAFGMIAAKAYKFSLVRSCALPILLIGLLAFFWGAIFEINSDSENFYRSWHRVIVWGVPSFLIILVAPSITQLKWSVLRFLGDASYSIYLCHPIGIFLYKRIFDRIPQLAEFHLLPTFLCFAFSVTLGCFCYILFEKPVTRKLKEWDHQQSLQRIAG
ncbi:MAG: acyltransferase [Pseudomonadota bacterium]